MAALSVAVRAVAGRARCRLRRTVPKPSGRSCRQCIIAPMALAEFYLPLKTAHVGLVTASGLLFALRGAAVLAGQRWPLQRPWRVLSAGIDTLLLAAGVSLWLALSLHPLQQPWLGTKLLLVLLYIGLGTLALRRARTQARRAACFAAALAVYLFIATVALRHHPLGVWA